MSSYKWTVTGNISIKDNVDDQQTVTLVADGNGILYLEVTNEHGCTSTCSKQILVQENAPCDLTGPENVCANTTNTYYTVPVDGVTYNWSVVGDATILSSMPYSNSIEVRAGGEGSYTVHLFIENPDACPSICQWTTTVELCGKPYCTYTQGYYGNTGGISCTPQGSKTTTELIQSSISNMQGGILYLGSAGRSFSASVEQTTKLIAILPGGGSPNLLPIGDWTPLVNSGITRRGKINNVLLSQTITLALNVYMPGSNLGDLSLVDAAGKYMITVDRKDGTCGSLTTEAASCKFAPIYGDDGITIIGYSTTYNPYRARYFSPAVINALGGSKTVKDLLNLASTALGGGGLPTGVTYSNLSDAVAAINEAFDKCKIFVSFTSSGDVSGYCTAPQGATTVIGGRKQLTESPDGNHFSVLAYPNPFKGQLNFRFVASASSRATLEVFNVFGQKLETVFDGEVTTGKTYFATFRKVTGGQNMLIYKLTLGSKVVTGKVQSMD